jgi:hypothetical protein
MGVDFKRIRRYLVGLRGRGEGFGACGLAGECAWDRGEVIMRRESFEGFSRSVKEDRLTCRGHPYMFQFFVNLFF